MADVEAAIESKDSRTRALLKEKEEKITRVKCWRLCMIEVVFIHREFFESSSRVLLYSPS